MLARLLIIPSTLLCLLAFGYVLATTGFPAHRYSIPAGSMIPTLVPGEMIFASGDYYRSHTPVPGDVVLFNMSWHGELTTFIKRVVAGPGDRVRMEGGRLFVNGVQVERTALPPDAAAADLKHYRESLPNGRSYEIVEISDDHFLDSLPETLVEPGHYFVMGDHRDASNDSRNPEFGAIALEAIEDRASVIWLSSNWRRIGKNVQPTP